MGNNNHTEKEKTLLEELKKHKIDHPNVWRIIKLLLHSLWLFPILIWLLYLIGSSSFGIPTDVSAGDMLGYFGSILSFIGTVALGALALWQNKRLEKLTEDALAIENTRLIPSILIQSGNIKYLYRHILRNESNNNSSIEYHVGDKNQDKECLIQYPVFQIDGSDNFENLCLTLQIINTSDTYITLGFQEGLVIDFNSETKIKNWSNGRFVGHEKSLQLMPGESGKIGFYFSEMFFKELTSNKNRVTFSLINRINDVYLSSIDLLLLGCDFETTKSLSIDFYSQNYTKPKKAN